MVPSIARCMYHDCGTAMRRREEGSLVFRGFAPSRGRKITFEAREVNRLVRGLSLSRGRKIMRITIKSPEGVFSNSVGHRPTKGHPMNNKQAESLRATIQYHAIAYAHSGLGESYDPVRGALPHAIAKHPFGAFLHLPTTTGLVPTAIKRVSATRSLQILVIRNS
jgi:hypothetical protein